MDSTRYWESDNCIIDLNEVCAISRTDIKRIHNVYKVTFRNGATTEFIGSGLVTQFKEFIKHRRMEMKDSDKKAFEEWRGSPIDQKLTTSEYSEFLKNNYEFDFLAKAWQAAIAYKQKEIDELNKSVEFFVSENNHYFKSLEKLEAENDELKSQIYVTGSVHKEGDIKREMTWQESSDMMESFNKGLMNELSDLKIKFSNVRAENKKMRAVIELASNAFCYTEYEDACYLAKKLTKELGDL